MVAHMQKGLKVPVRMVASMEKGVKLLLHMVAHMQKGPEFYYRWWHTCKRVCKSCG